MKNPINNLPQSFSGTWINISLLALSILFMAGGAVNNGFTWFLLAIPFVILFFIQLRYFSKIQVAGILIVVIVILIPLGWNHPENRLLYPYLGAVAEFQQGWGYEQFSDSKYFSLVSPESVPFSRKFAASQPEFFTLKLVMLDGPVVMTMVRVGASHPDFSTVLRPIFKDSKGDLFSVNSDRLLEGIENGTVISDDLQNVKSLPTGGLNQGEFKILQSRWSWLLGNLMYGPLFPFIIISLVTGFISNL